MKQLQLNGSFRYSKEAAAIAERSLRPRPIKFNEATVTFSVDDGVLCDYLQAEYQAIEYEFGRTFSEMKFTQDEFIQYCKTFLVSRIAWVNGFSNLLLIRPEARLICPAFLAQVLMNVGIATDDHIGFEIRPGFKEWNVEKATTKVSRNDLALIKNLTGFDVLSDERVREISFWLGQLENYVGAFGYLKDRTGSWDFMTMSLVQQEVLAPENTSHGVYAIMAATLGNQLVHAALSMKVTYGDVAIFKSLVQELVSV